MSLQDLLDEQAALSKSGKDTAEVDKLIHEQRGPAPCCFGEDDCSSWALSLCAWRRDCGTVVEPKKEEPLVINLQGLLRLAYGQGMIKGMNISMHEYREDLKCMSGLDMEAELCAEGMEDFNKLLKECLDQKSIVLSKELVL